MATRSSKVNEIRPGVQAQWADPKEEQALATDISTQLANLPTVIADDTTYRRAKESLPLLKRYETRVVDFFKDMKADAHRTWKGICDKESSQLRPITQARARLSQLIYGFEQKQERDRREKQRQEEEQERKRREAEALEQADALQAHSPELAEQLIEEAIAAPAPVVVLPAATVDVAGVNESKARYVWRYLGAADHETGWKKLTPEQRRRVMALLPKEHCMPDESAIGALVRSKNGDVRIPGIEVYDIGSITVRG